MVFLQRSAPPNRRKRRPAPVSDDDLQPRHVAAAAVATEGSDGGDEGNEGSERDFTAFISVLADAGCTLLATPGAPPSLPADPHRFGRCLEGRLSVDPSLRSRFVAGFSAYTRTPQNLKRVLIPASQDGGFRKGESLARILLLVAPIQAQILLLLLEKIPEHFDAYGNGGLPLKDDVARLIVKHFMWLDFLVDAEGFIEKLMEVVSISPPQLKKEIVGSLPEIIGEQCNGTVVTALDRLLQEDSEIILPVLDSFSNLNLDEQLQEQAITTALSCIRTVEADHMPHLLRFLLLSSTPANVRRILSQIREQLKFAGVINSHACRNKKLKGKSPVDSTDASILDALRLSLLFKNILSEAILKEMNSLDQPREHKVIDVWLIVLIHTNGGCMMKNSERMLKKKILDGCFHKVLFEQCINGQRELVKDYFPSFLSITAYLLSCKEPQAKMFGIHLYTSLFEEFSDTYSRQEILGALVTHIGSGVGHEVCSALETMILVTSKHAEQLVPISSHITGILDYLDGFHEQNLRKVYEVFCQLALAAYSSANSIGSSILNELLIIIRKQVGNPDIKYRKMGIIGTIKIVSTLGGVNATASYMSTQKSNGEEALELLKLSVDSCKLMSQPLILLYDELIVLLESTNLQPVIIEWISQHVGEFESLFLSDLVEGQLPVKSTSNGIEGELWMNLDGVVSPVCLNVLPLLFSSMEQCSSSLQFLPSQFLLLSIVERVTNHGSLGGIDALLGCPIHLPSFKQFLVGADGKKLTDKQKWIICSSIYYAINWIRELLNAFSTQIIGRVGSISHFPSEELVPKIMKRLRNLVLLEGLLNAYLKCYPLSLPELHYSAEHYGSSFSRRDNTKSKGKKSTPSILHDKNQKQKKDSMTVEKPDANGKLRQPTIMDVLRRAGAIESQEVSSAGSSGATSNRPHCQENEIAGCNELGLVDISEKPICLESQRFKFRPLLVDCLSILSFSEKQDSCCSDSLAELPLHLYLIRDFNSKLEYLSPSSKLTTTCSVKTLAGYTRMATGEFLNRVRSLFTSLKKHLDSAVSFLQYGSESCEDHWKSSSLAAGNPDLPYISVSKISVATSVFKEVLYCYSKLLSMPDLFLKTNLSVLRDMLEAFQPIEKLDQFLFTIKPLPTPGSIDYLYCGAFAFYEGIMDIAFSFSFTLASEALVTLESIVNSYAMLTEPCRERNGKRNDEGSSECAVGFLRSRLALSSRKLLLQDPCKEDSDKGNKNRGDMIQKILQIYLKYSESTSELLDELACKVLPQVPSHRATNTQEAMNGFPTLSPMMFLIWYRVLHEENLSILSKTVKEVTGRSRRYIQGEAAKPLIIKLRQTVNVVVALVNMCKVHDKVVVHAMAVKYGGKYMDRFLKVFDFLQDQFQAHNDIILELVKELQKGTRTIQTICSEAKGLKRTMVTSKVPATKRSMERFLFHVKALLHSTPSNCTFWMGNLKHKDLSGQVVSSQVYDNGEDGMPQEMENSDEDNNSIGPAQRAIEVEDLGDQQDDD
ncbi:Fanconi anemia group D2 protein homolog isoform X1 [Zingiber officinale]|uniref:Fanconi anemia group D2 protein homolog isoform X1 n=1 Tax=Zingiber officinale TaxID=94328 RepID=UPI001C4C5448|nr:Fanconi anemia group D2 protein homolog isoform X1 [Zingiber officinale]